MTAAQGESSSSTIEVLDLAGIEEAKDLFVRLIPLVRREGLDDVAGEEAAVRRWMVRTTGQPGPDHTWLGVRDNDGALVAATHAAPNFGQAVQMLDAPPPPAGPTAGWLVRYVNTIASFEELATLPGYRRTGLGRALLRATSRSLRARGCTAGSGAATSPAAIQLVKSAGFTVGGHRQPVPPAFAGGAQTIWWEDVPEDVRYFWTRFAPPGAAFGVGPGPNTRRGHL